MYICKLNLQAQKCIPFGYPSNENSAKQKCLLSGRIWYNVFLHIGVQLLWVDSMGYNWFCALENMKSCNPSVLRNKVWKWSVSHNVLTLIPQRAKACPPVQRLPQRPEGELMLIIDISWIEGRMFITLQDHRNAACLHGTRPLQQSLPRGVRKHMMSSGQNKQLEISEKKNGLIFRNLVV